MLKVYNEVVYMLEINQNSYKKTGEVDVMSGITRNIGSSDYY